MKASENERFIQEISKNALSIETHRFSISRAGKGGWWQVYDKHDQTYLFWSDIAGRHLSFRTPVAALDRLLQFIEENELYKTLAEDL